ncbi:hypothetical protein [Rhodococcus sp. As11]
MAIGRATNVVTIRVIGLAAITVLTELKWLGAIAKRAVPPEGVPPRIE